MTMNWRTLMKGDGISEIHPQYPQNLASLDHFEDSGEEMAVPEQQEFSRKSRIGQWVAFDSPRFGLCTGQVSLVAGKTIVVNFHSELKTYTTIQANWIVRVLGGPPTVV